VLTIYLIGQTGAARTPDPQTAKTFQDVGYTRCTRQGYFDKLREMHALDTSQAAPPLETCTWTYSDTKDSWKTECGHLFLIYGGSLDDNNMKFCSYCGRRLTHESQ
jgi:hypothetical protein